MPLGPDSGCEFACGVDDVATDDGRSDELVVAVDHPLDVGCARVRRFGICTARSVEASRVDDGDVGPLALPKVAGVEAIPIGEFAGEPAHGGLGRHPSTILK